MRLICFEHVSFSWIELKRNLVIVILIQKYDQIKWHNNLINYIKWLIYVTPLSPNVSTLIFDSEIIREKDAGHVYAHAL